MPHPPEPSALAHRRPLVSLDTIELRVGLDFSLVDEDDGPARIAWVVVNGEAVDGYTSCRSWARARRMAQRVANELWYHAKRCGLSAHPSTRPQWTAWEEG